MPLVNDHDPICRLTMLYNYTHQKLREQKKRTKYINVPEKKSKHHTKKPWIPAEGLPFCQVKATDFSRGSIE